MNTEFTTQFQIRSRLEGQGESLLFEDNSQKQAVKDFRLTLKEFRADSIPGKVAVYEWNVVASEYRKLFEETL